MVRAAKACTDPSCPNTQPCPTHQRQPWQGHNGRHGRMRSGSREQKINRAVMLRDEGLCECGALASQVDHVIPLSEGGSDGMENRRAICDPCHAEKTARESARGRGAT
jgi:5-methylcytosine-specific restriction protein A